MHIFNYPYLPKEGRKKLMQPSEKIKQVISFRTIPNMVELFQFRSQQHKFKISQGNIFLNFKNLPKDGRRKLIQPSEQIRAVIGFRLILNTTGFFEFRGQQHKFKISQGMHIFNYPYLPKEGRKKLMQPSEKIKQAMSFRMIPNMAELFEFRSQQHKFKISQGNNFLKYPYLPREGRKKLMQPSENIKTVISFRMIPNMTDLCQFRGQQHKLKFSQAINFLD